MDRRLEQRWTMSSYSALARLATEMPENAPGVRPDVAALALPDEPRLDAYLEAYAAERNDAALDGDADAGTAVIPEQGSSLHDFPRGAAPGSLLHGLLEWVLRQGPRDVLADPVALRTQVERRCRSRKWEAHAPAVADWLQQFFTRPFRLAPADGEVPAELVLADLSGALPEMEFWFGVRQAALPAFDALVTRHFLPGLPRPGISSGQLNGMLRGFMDLVFEHEGRYYVADYKSNWLGARDDAYDDAALARAMLEHRYDLQAAIYLFALHRLLESRLGAAYDYDRHVGGALVFFMRGSNAASQGMVAMRPGCEVLAQMERLFEGAEGGMA